MKPREWGLGALLLVGLTAACGDGDGTTDPAAGPGVIAGTVARQKTAEGIGGAVIAVVDDAGAVRGTTVTDGAGRFHIGGLAQGAYRVHLVAPMLAGLDPRYDALEPEAWDVALGSDPVELVFAVVGLVPARITGTVSCGGAARSGVEVRVVGGVTDARTTTDGAGLFTVLDLLPGTYAVIPLSPPCDVAPAFEAVTIRPGQFLDLTFAG